MRTCFYIVPVNVVLLVLSNPVRSYAFSPEYDLGAELQVYRDVVSPSLFPVTSFGIKADSRTEANHELGATDETKIDARFRISPTNPQAFALTGQNFYYGDPDESTESSIRFSFGRRLIGWTKLDDLWDLGIFEPLDAWDRLRAEPQGLTGIFGYTETKKISFRVFASFLYLPETTPNVVISNSQLVSVDPQSTSSAPQSIKLLNRDFPLNYNLNVPSLEKIVFRPSIVLSAETKAELPFFAKVSYGYLPLNYFPIAIQGVFNLTNSSVPAQLVPLLMNHNVYNAELAYRFGNSISTGLIFLVDDPLPYTIPSDYTTAPLNTETNLSPWIEYQDLHFKITLSQLWTNGGILADVGTQAHGANSSTPNQLSSHIFFRDASQLKARFTFEALDPRSSYLEGKYVHDYSVSGDWIAADYGFWMSKHFSAYVGGDVINATLPFAPNLGAEFLSDVQALDRVRVGVHYVF